MILIDCALFICGIFTFSCTSSYADTTKHKNWELLENYECGISNSDRIIGGKNASMGMYPWMARIGYINLYYSEISFKCGGTLINDKYVVTAAHCLTDLPENIMNITVISSPLESKRLALVRLGEHNTETDPDCEDEYCAEPVQDFEPTKIISHEDYDENNRNDIGLIRLDRPVEFNECVMPICMPCCELLTADLRGEKAEVAGWGIYDLENPEPSIILQSVKVPIVDLDNCIEAFAGKVVIGKSQLCAGGIIGEDSCSGDSGGPLMKAESVDGPPKYYFIGLVSFGPKKCGLTATPAVYTKIVDYISWILDNISL